MSQRTRAAAGEDLDLRGIHAAESTLHLQDRADRFEGFLEELARNETLLYRRCVQTAADREVEVWDSLAQETRKLLMFGSNNYLGLANHPHVTEKTIEAVRHYGVGVGGPPLLNGHTRLHAELEERLAALKHTETAVIFSSGYSANVGLISGLVRPQDRVLYDVHSHASLWDGIRLSRAETAPFPHNDPARLERLLRRYRATEGADVFVCVEGVYSMDGDVAPLREIVTLCSEYGATLILDDAHGTGVLGEHGRGTAEHLGVEGEVPITVGTFSKALAVTGGFVATTRSVADYLRFNARSHVFSASLPPSTVAAVLAGLDVIEGEPWRLTALRSNVAYLAAGLRRLGFSARPDAAIVPIPVPRAMDIRRAGRRFQDLGIFLNSIEYPAVQASQQRFRVSVMATHRKEDLDHLLSAVEQVWCEFVPALPSSRDANVRSGAAVS